MGRFCRAIRANGGSEAKASSAVRLSTDVATFDVDLIVVADDLPEGVLVSGQSLIKNL